MTITYRTGDATLPPDPPRTVVIHVCNDVAKFGSGFAAAIAQRYPLARDRFLEHGPRQLGTIQWVAVGLHVPRPTSWWNHWVVNMVAQHGVRSSSNPVPLDLDALAICLAAVADGIATMAGPVTLHMPRIGCGLAGGTWDEVGPLVEASLGHLDVYVYDLPA